MRIKVADFPFMKVNALALAVINMTLFLLMNEQNHKHKCGFHHPQCGHGTIDIIKCVTATANNSGCDNDAIIVTMSNAILCHCTCTSAV